MTLSSQVQVNSLLILIKKSMQLYLPMQRHTLSN